MTRIYPYLLLLIINFLNIEQSNAFEISSIYSEKITVRNIHEGFKSEIFIRTRSANNIDSYYLFYDSFNKISVHDLDVWDNVNKKFRKMEINEEDYSSPVDLFISNFRTKQILVPKGIPFRLKYTEENSELMLLKTLRFSSQCPVDTFHYEIMIPKELNLYFQIRNPESLHFFSADSVLKKDHIIYIFTGVNKNDQSQSAGKIQKPDCHIEMIAVPSEFRGKETTYFNNWYLKKINAIPSLDDDSKREIDSIVAGNKYPDSIALTLYRYVQKNIKYIDIETSYGCFIPRDPNQIMNRKMGDCKDKANLLREALAYKGIPSRLVITTTANEKNVTDFPSLNDANHAILMILIPGKDPVFVDPTEEFADYGYTGILTQGKPGFAFGDKGGDWVILSVVPPEKNIEHYEMILKKSGDSITGTMTITMVGLPSDLFRTYFSPLKEEEKQAIIKTALNFVYRNLDISDLTFSVINDSVSIQSSIRINKHQIVSIDSCNFLSFDFLPRPVDLPKYDELPDKVELFYTVVKKLDVRIDFEERIKNLTKNYPSFCNDLFSFNITSSINDRTIFINYEYIAKRPTILKEESSSYNDFRTFVSKTFGSAIKYCKN